MHWRTYKEFKPCFLDIETTGLSRHYDDITVIGLYNGRESKFFVKDDNMHEFAPELNKYPLVVTYNGKCFDLPFIQHKFPSLNLNKFHIDLRFEMKKIGFSGGLKSIERQLGLNRDSSLKDIDGFEAVRLWYRYKRRGDDEALRLLLKYNQADIENLKTLMDLTYDRLRASEFLSRIE
ncbi:ribonuclease H-like domain-containing protein [Candidatus Woesearchaeota archaeon]|nr:ribonuclease H-like domain-containing protein [Candidatus Woesearchaeota archaeon]